MTTPATYDSCRPLKLETAFEGGSSPADLYPTEITTTQDAVAAAGVYLDGPSVSAPDKTVLVDRASGGQMRFTDQTAQQTLSNIVGAAYNGFQPHSGLPDACHLDSFGPDVAFASGAYEQRTMSGPLLTNITWWTSSSMTQRIFQIAIAYNGPLPSALTRTTYTNTGAVARTIVDALSYSGPLLVGRTRTWS